ncbi:hypothetical protein [Nocardia sp. NBC_01009]|uniref:hypothetical protein n=1 Tax=Nocardia sp. NBC_01009 TaxID=2975996 RepID=UPI00386DBC8F|nr:hypothetical protein OHA42_36460 [Nocardia sp. NBC_01009]
MNVRRSMTAHTASPAEAAPTELVATDSTTRVQPTVATHRVTYSDRLKVFIGPDETVDNFLRPLCRLDGYHRYAVNMSRLLSPLPATDITTAVGSARGASAVQCTGSTNALVIEIWTAVDGVPQHFIVGLPGSRDSEPTVCIPDGTDFLRVYADEVFTAAHAAQVFATYFHTDDIPPGFQLREVLG